VLDHDGKIIRESLFIVEYVDESFPGALLYPATQYDKYLSRLIVSEFDGSVIFPFFGALKNQVKPPKDLSLGRVPKQTLKQTLGCRTAPRTRSSPRSSWLASRR